MLKSIAFIIILSLILGKFSKNKIATDIGIFNRGNNSWTVRNESY